MNNSWRNFGRVAASSPAVGCSAGATRSSAQARVDSCSSSSRPRQPPMVPAVPTTPTADRCRLRRKNWRRPPSGVTVHPVARIDYDVTHRARRAVRRLALRRADDGHAESGRRLLLRNPALPAGLLHGRAEGDAATAACWAAAWSSTATSADSKSKSSSASAATSKSNTARDRSRQLLRD